MKKPAMTISRVAKLTGIGVETIRYYERIGLIRQPEKPENSYRVYPADTISHISFIIRAKELGFSLSEIADLLQLENSDCSQTQYIAERKLHLIQDKISDLQSMATVLGELVETCKKTASGGSCAIISTLGKK